jgi:ubiquinone/menaquinone biosynthesis C-methylase UbiE
MINAITKQQLEAFSLIAGMPCADLGAGNGMMSFALDEFLQGKSDVFAVEVQEFQVDNLKQILAKKAHGRIIPIHGDIEELGGTKLRPNSIDRIIAARVLFQIEKPENFFTEIKRILAPNGEVLLIDTLEIAKTSHAHLATHRTLEEAKALVAKNGFSVVRIPSALPNEWALIIKKS